MADEPISGLPSATLPLGGNETAPIVQSGVTCQVPISAFGQSAESICTSSTRPASPFSGQLIYETDTGRFMQFQTVTTGWTPIWNTAWGELSGGYTQATTTPADISTAEATVIACGAVTVVPNRIIIVQFHAPNVQGVNASEFVKTFVTDNANVHLGLLGRDALVAGADTTIGIDREFRLTGISGSFQPKIRAVFNSGSGAARFNASASIDPGPIYTSIRDIGPAGPPA